MSKKLTKEEIEYLAKVNPTIIEEIILSRKHNKEKHKEWIERNQKYIKEYAKKYYQRPEVKERIKKYYREYNQRPEVKERRNEYERRRYQKNKEKCRAK